MATDHSKQHYYSAKSAAGGYKGRIYHYDTTGNREINFWLSDKIYNTKDEAEDAACQHIEDNNLEETIGEVQLG